jgi:membrane protease YdiL (CAAX protease family)
MAADLAGSVGVLIPRLWAGDRMQAPRDFPFYNDQPIALSGKYWLVLLGSLGLAFAVLVLLPLRSFPAKLIPASLFLIIPLLALRVVAGPYWTALFHRVGLKQIALMIGFALLTLAGSIVVSMVLQQMAVMKPNGVSEAMRDLSGAELVGSLIPTIPQLIGEEFLGILPFLAVLWVCVTRLHMPRRVGIAVAVGVSALIFGAAHLPTYDWNWSQALIGIGAARVFLTLAYIATRNLWVSAGAHILNDWAGFLMAFAVGHAPIGTET